MTGEDRYLINQSPLIKSAAQVFNASDGYYFDLKEYGFSGYSSCRLINKNHDSYASWGSGDADLSAYYSNSLDSIPFASNYSCPLPSTIYSQTILPSATSAPAITECCPFKAKTVYLNTSSSSTRTLRVYWDNTYSRCVIKDPDSSSSSPTYVYSDGVWLFLQAAGGGGGGSDVFWNFTLPGGGGGGSGASALMYLNCRKLYDINSSFTSYFTISIGHYGEIGDKQTADTSGGGDGKDADDLKVSYYAYYSGNSANKVDLLTLGGGKGGGKGSLNQTYAAAGAGGTVANYCSDTNVYANVFFSHAGACGGRGVGGLDAGERGGSITGVSDTLKVVASTFYASRTLYYSSSKAYFSYGYGLNSYQLTNGSTTGLVTYNSYAGGGGGSFCLPVSLDTTSSTSSEAGEDVPDGITRIGCGGRGRSYTSQAKSDGTQAGYGAVFVIDSKTP